MITLNCEMFSTCNASVTHLDENGYIYCAEHGQLRQRYCRCRKLRPYELNRLRKGQTVTKY